jgi:hypothetical protein
MPIRVLGTSSASDFLSIGDSPLPAVSTGVLISWWVKTRRQYLTDNRRFFSSSGDTFDLYAAQVSGTNRQARGNRSGGFSGYGNMHGLFADGVDEWRHMAAIWTSAGNVGVYADGTKLSRQFFSGSAITSTPSSWQLFRRSGSTGGIEGLHADFTIWTGAVDPDDIGGDAGKIAAQAAMIAQLKNGAAPAVVTLPSGFALHDRFKFRKNLLSESGLFEGVISTSTSADAIELIDDDSDVPPVDDYIPPTTGGRRSRLLAQRRRPPAGIIF